MATLTVLLVEDNEPDARYIRELLGEFEWRQTAVGGERIESVDVHHVKRLSRCLDHQQTTAVDVILLDLNLPDSRNLDTLAAVLGAATDETVIVLTGLDDERAGVEAIERGAQDYLVKDDVDARLLGRTIRHAVERQRRERRLERRNEELTLLNRLVRHDIRDDMALVRGWGQALSPHVDSEGEQYLDRMLEASQHVLDFTDTVGEFLETLGNRDDVELHPLELDATVRSEIEKTRSVHTHADITIDGELPAAEVAATELLPSVFRNLLANAIQHNDTDSPEVVVSGLTDKEMVTIRIADNGPGVPPAKRDAIFGRTENGLADPDCGVGLYLVDTLVDLYGGSVDVRENEPRGAVFEVRLRRTDS